MLVNNNYSKKEKFLEPSPSDTSSRLKNLSKLYKNNSQPLIDSAA